MELGQQVDVLR
jgi:hypothetical protein